MPRGRPKKSLKPKEVKKAVEETPEDVLKPPKEGEFGSQTAEIT